MRTMPLAGALAGLLLTAACSPSVQHQDGAAAPAGSPAQVTSAPAGTSPASPPPPSVPGSAPATGGAPAGALVLGPNGLGALRLGMTRQQATATGLLSAFDDSAGGGCAPASLRAAPADQGTVMLSPTLGIATIDAYGTIKTPEGLHIGSSSADMLRLYPTWQMADGTATNGRGHAKTPGNDKAVYRLATKSGVVTEITLQFVNQNCYE
ncbi:hypothetical protein [Dactylosporangium sp. CA-092794]|uniref:hypothetical protein n=1 Tax=Dactylosporangium sp. CA-092794 TaxID=3239929 RepID=UPI003D8F8D88